MSDAQIQMRLDAIEYHAREIQAELRHLKATEYWKVLDGQKVTVMLETESVTLPREPR